MGWDRADLWQHVDGRCWRDDRSVPDLVLQIKGHADDHRALLLPGLDKGIPDLCGHPRHVVKRMIGRPCGRDDRPLVDPLIVPTFAQRRLARKDDDRQVGAHGGWQCGQHLRQARPAGGGCHPNGPGLAGIGHRGGHGAMFVPDIDHPAAAIGHPGGPVHIGIPKKGKAGVYPFVQKRRCKGVIDPWHQEAASASRAAGTITSPRAIRRAVRIRPAACIVVPSGPWE